MGVGGHPLTPQRYCPCIPLKPHKRMAPDCHGHPFLTPQPCWPWTVNAYPTSTTGMLALDCWCSHDGPHRGLDSRLLTAMQSPGPPQNAGTASRTFGMTSRFAKLSFHPHLCYASHVTQPCRGIRMCPSHSTSHHLALKASPSFTSTQQIHKKTLCLFTNQKHAFLSTVLSFLFTKTRWHCMTKLENILQLMKHLHVCIYTYKFMCCYW